MAFEIDSTILVAVISLIGTIIIGVMANDKFTKSDAVRLESRLTSIETILTTKLDPIWNAIASQIPKLLISPNTPVFDKLLHSVIDKGLESLTSDEITELKKNLNDAYKDAIKKEKSGRAVAITLYKAILEVK